jgi:hypothetical protein
MNIHSLYDISLALEYHIQNPEAEVFTFVQTGYDETSVVATEDGYLKLAKEIIDFLIATREGKCQPYSIGNIQGQGDCSVGSVFSSISDVELDSLMLVNTATEAEKVIRYFQPDMSAE